MTEFQTYSHDGGDRPFAVHTANETLMGRTDIDLSHFHHSASTSSAPTQKDAACNTVGPQSLTQNFDLKDPCHHHENEETWVSSPRRKPAYRDTKTSALRTLKGQALIPEGGNQRACGACAGCKKQKNCVEHAPDTKSYAPSNDAVRYRPSGDGGDIDPDTEDTDDYSTASRSDVKSQSMTAQNEETACARQAALWRGMQTALEGLAARGFDRTMVYSTLPFIKSHVLDPSLDLVHKRLLKRVSDTWQADEPSEVVLLCQAFLEAYDEVLTLSGHGSV